MSNKLHDIALTRQTAVHILLVVDMMTTVSHNAHINTHRLRAVLVVSHRLYLNVLFLKQLISCAMLSVWWVQSVTRYGVWVSSTVSTSAIGCIIQQFVQW